MLQLLHSFLPRSPLATLYRPAGHAAHFVFSVAFEAAPPVAYLPRPQRSCLQLACPVWSWYVFPGSHASHEDALEAPAAAPALPAWHATQAVMSLAPSNTP